VTRRSREWSKLGTAFGLLKAEEENNVPPGFIENLYVFVLAGFVGFEVIRRVSPLLHTPLMSLTNALDAIVVVAAIIICGRAESTLAVILGAVAVAAAFSNMIGGFLITDRMLRMFKLSGRKKQ
jgi:H+-translocating NAD(P) transhydrogenase subunit alpha